jgi:electron transport complex protein RnfE
MTSSGPSPSQPLTAQHASAQQASSQNASAIQGSQVGRIAIQGLWKNNPALVQLLGLCPLLAVTSTVVNALGLGLATLCVLVGSNVVVSCIKSWVKPAIRLPIFVMIIASLVTVVELLMQAFAYELYEILGIFIPLIVTNCAILGRADAFASKNSMLLACFDGVMMGCGFLLVLLVLGALREVIGQGTLFADMHLLFGEGARHWRWVLFESYPPLLFAILPPGAFLAMGLLVAIKNFIDAHLLKSESASSESGSKRVRVTGPVS